MALDPTPPNRHQESAPDHCPLRGDIGAHLPRFCRGHSVVNPANDTYDGFSYIYRYARARDADYRNKCHKCHWLASHECQRSEEAAIWSRRPLNPRAALVFFSTIFFSISFSRKSLRAPGDSPERWHHPVYEA